MNMAWIGKRSVLAGITMVGALTLAGCQESPGELPKASIAPAADPVTAPETPAVGRVTIPPHISSNHLPVTPSSAGVAEEPYGAQSPTGGLDASGPSQPPRDSFLPPAGNVDPPAVAPLEAELQTAPRDPFLR